MSKQPLIKLPPVLEKLAPKQSPELDYSTNLNYRSFFVGLTNLDFAVNFEKKALIGFVEYELERKDDAEAVFLDVTTVSVSSVEIDGKPTQFSIKTEGLNNKLGNALVVPLQKDTKKFVLKVGFESLPSLTALQFLDKAQTDGKKAGYLFSQSEPIHARLIFPCFDTPGVKTPYKVRVVLPQKTLVSCLPDSEAQEKETDKNVYHFKQPVPIPAYLFAIVSGDIEGAKIGPRSTIYTEPVGLERCAAEFKDEVVEKFLGVLENLLFPYEWSTYDFVVAPMAFPYGGMENPQLTLANLTVVSGDGENIDVIAHELAHSYSGNLVTNASWEHFWLNEGWTVYLERRILAGLHGEKYRHFSAIIGWQDLEESIDQMDKKYTKLIQNLKDGSDPDDAFSTVPYEKGFNFLFHLENVVGGTSEFDPFIRHYFTTFRKTSLDTYQFIECLLSFYYHTNYSIYEKLLEVDYETWLLKEGLPPKPQFDTSLVDVCISLGDKYYSFLKSANGEPIDFTQFPDLETSDYSSNQLVVFLDHILTLHKKHDFLNSDNGRAMLRYISSYLRIVKNLNAEVRFRMYRLFMLAREQKEYDSFAEWLGTVGRMKFVRPGYMLLNECDRKLAISTFERFKGRYHPICVAMVKKDISLD